VVVESSVSEKVNGTCPDELVEPESGDKVYWDSDSDKEREALERGREVLE
jgi:hypothetical protein